MQKVIKYHNAINNINFNKFSAPQMNVFMALCWYVRQEGKCKIYLADLRKTANVTMHNQQLIELLYEFSTLTFINNDNMPAVEKLFTISVIDTDKDGLAVYIEVTEECKYLVVDVNSECTQVDLKEFLSLDDKHAKHLYRLLKQHCAVGQISITDLEKFKTQMGCTTYKINEFIRKLELAKLKNSCFFRNLEIKKEYEAKKGAPLKNINIRFEKDVKLEFDNSSRNSTEIKEKEKNMNNNMYCRKISIQEIEDVCKLYLKEENVILSDNELKTYIENAREIYFNMLLVNCYTYGCFKGNQLIGTINVNKILDYYPRYIQLPYVHLETFIIAKEYQHKGIGTFLVQNVVEQIKKEGCTYIIMQSDNKFVEKIARKAGLTSSLKDMRHDFIAEEE